MSIVKNLTKKEIEKIQNESGGATSSVAESTSTN